MTSVGPRLCCKQRNSGRPYGELCLNAKIISSTSVRHVSENIVYLDIVQFSNDCRKPVPKQLLRPITTGVNSAMNQSEFLAITCNLLKARENSRVQGAIGFGFASNRLKNRREIFKPITKRDDRNRVTAIDRHLKTALMFRCFKIAGR